VSPPVRLLLIAGGLLVVLVGGGFALASSLSHQAPAYSTQPGGSSEH
jgi:hypothetical protein